jgi:hypothetical protein
LRILVFFIESSMMADYPQTPADMRHRRPACANVSFGSRGPPSCASA